MEACPIPRLLEKSDRLDLRSIALFFNKYFPDEYIVHIIEYRGEYQYERIKIGKAGASLPRVIIHKPTIEDFADIISPSKGKRELLKPNAKVYLGKAINVLFFEIQDFDGKMKHYVELHDDSVIVRITPTGFTVFSANYCRAFSETETENKLN